MCLLLPYSLPEWLYWLWFSGYLEKQPVQFAYFVFSETRFARNAFVWTCSCDWSCPVSDSKRGWSGKYLIASSLAEKMWLVCYTNPDWALLISCLCFGTVTFLNWPKALSFASMYWTTMPTTPANYPLISTLPLAAWSTFDSLRAFWALEVKIIVRVLSVKW